MHPIQSFLNFFLSHSDHVAVGQANRRFASDDGDGIFLEGKAKLWCVFPWPLSGYCELFVAGEELVRELLLH